MKTRFLLIPLLFAGCQQDSSTNPAAASLPIVSQGMPIEDAVALVRGEGLSIEESTPGIVSDGEDVTVKYYRINVPHRLNDALFLVTTTTEDTQGELVDEIFWHIDYVNDAKLPKSERKDQLEQVIQIDLRTLNDSKG